MINKLIMINLMLIISLIWGCKNESSVWLNAKKSGKISDYKFYLHEYPNGKFIKDAKLALDSIKAKTVWDSITIINTISSYNDFIKNYGNSSLIKEAKKNIKKLYWEKLVSQDTYSAYKYFYDKYPDSKFDTLNSLIIDDPSLIYIISTYPFFYTFNS